MYLGGGAAANQNAFGSTPQFQFSRSPFEFPSKHYESYQENGTKYLKSLKAIPEQAQNHLNACAGEIFLSGIPPTAKAEQIAEIASLLGELYILRFKVNFSGDSRGFAYLQYLDPSLMQLAIVRLPLHFRQHSLPTVRVRESRNSSKLLLKKTYRMSPQSVFEMLRKLITFHKLVGREIFPGYFEYQIIFKCNEEAVHARRELLRTISKFGRNAIVVWDTTTSNDANSETPLPAAVVVPPYQQQLAAAAAAAAILPRPAAVVVPPYQQQLAAAAAMLPPPIKPSNRWDFSLNEIMKFNNK